MAKAPSAKVSKTSGQGVSRLSYQKGRALSGKTGGASTGIDASFGKSELGSGGNRYAKSDVKPEQAGGFNVSYGDTIMPTDLEDVKAMGEGAAPKQSGAMKPGKAKTWSKK